MKRLSIIPFVAIFLMVSMMTGFTQPPTPGNPPAGADKLVRGLGLSPEQQTRIAQLRLELQKQNLPLQAKLNEYQAQLKLLLVDDQFSTARAKAILQKIGDVRQQIALNRLQFQRKVREMLTPEQRVKFDNRILSQSHHPRRPKGQHPFQRSPRR